MMVEIKDFDADSYELEFEEDTPEEERRFYVKKYPNVNMVADSRLHCTTCNTHIGCSVANEATIRMHPILRVTHCKKCHTFYNSGEFSKGEDGSELYCRWCGQGGEVYCCSKCPYVFCKKCIVQNLPRGKISEIENNDNWMCFSCSPRDMFDLRAQHWALVNYIEKTKQKILRDEKDDEKIYELMNKDPTLCCREKKERKSRSKDAKRKRKRRYYSTSSSSGCSTPEPKRIQDHSAVLPKMVAPSVQQKTVTKQLDELVCTPDILSMFSEPADVPPVRVAASKSTAPVVPISAPVAANQKSAASQPPPLIIRQLPTSSQTVRFPNRQFSAVPRAAPAVAPPPAYYTVNGFRVDLNAAAQQETYRLPNGKLIQVKKQTAANQANASNSVNRGVQPRANNTNPNPYSIRFNVQPSLPAQPVQVQPTHQSLHQTHLQQQQQILNGMNTAMSSGMTSVMTSGLNTGMNTGMNSSGMNPGMNSSGMNSGMSNAPMVPMNTMPTVPIANKYPNTPLGLSQSQLETQIQKAQEICQHIVGKLNALMKSNAYKSVRNYNDVKELHLHLSYLYTYTIERFKTAQEKCTEDMKVLSNAHEAANKLADKKNKYTNVDDDLEVVEPTTVCIEIDSDDENDANKSIAPVVPTIASVAKKSKQPRKTSLQPKSQDSHPASTTNVINKVTPIEVTETIDADEFELPTPPALEENTENETNDGVDETYDRENDEKLKSLPTVVLEINEMIERKLKEIMDNETNGSASPVANDEIIEVHNDTVDDEPVDECGKTAIESATNEPAKQFVESGKEPVDESDKMSVHESEEEPTKEFEKEAAEVEVGKTSGESEKESAEPGEMSGESEKESAEPGKMSGESEKEYAEPGESEKEYAEPGESEKESNRESENSAKESINESPKESFQESTDIFNISDRTIDDDDDDDDDDDETNEMHKLDNKMDDYTNGQMNDDLTRSSSPTLTDNLENEFLDDLDNQQSGLTDNSFENISSPDMFDDMSKNGFDRPDMNMVHLSTENADPDLV